MSSARFTGNLAASARATSSSTRLNRASGKQHINCGENLPITILSATESWFSLFRVSTFALRVASDSR
jgi:hypothetical protein